MNSLDLVLDTSRKGIAMGIYDSQGKVLSEIFEPDARGERLELLLSRALKEASASLDEIMRVLVTLGPGSFTGLRTGIAFGQGLCFSGSRSLYGVSTLKALKMLSECPATTAVILKARPGYWYLGNSEGEFFIPTETLLDQIKDETFFVCDSDAFDFLSAQIEDKKSLLLSKGNEIQTFLKCFSELQPSLVQEANYIQPSYFQKSGS